MRFIIKFFYVKKAFYIKTIPLIRRNRICSLVRKKKKSITKINLKP
ncbi:hypothetical protein CNEO3_170024 [Clostridium neonatale]|nr:hypothetical protein CNEO3_170024 [Clostridium neonatale]